MKNQIIKSLINFFTLSTKNRKGLGRQDHERLKIQKRVNQTRSSH